MNDKCVEPDHLTQCRDDAPVSLLRVTGAARMSFIVRHDAFGANPTRN